MKQLIDVVVHVLFIHEMPVHEINYTITLFGLNNKINATVCINLNEFMFNQ